jgi:hypothetical protein
MDDFLLGVQSWLSPTIHDDAGSRGRHDDLMMPSYDAEPRDGCGER